MARVFITGSSGGLGRLVAQSLLAGGHDVLVHVRDDARLTTAQDLVARGAALVVGDLADGGQTHDVARQVDELGPVDAVIHNAGVDSGPSVLAVNVVALTC
jgi:NADP-dependent 3-hydroxy acid dehydrogenase YdfG